MIRLAAFALVLAMPAAHAESNYCAGYRVGYLFTYCRPNDGACLRSTVRCPRSGITLDQGFRDGRALALNARRLEVRLVIEILRRAQNEKDRNRNR